MSDEKCMAEAVKDILKHAKTGTLIIKSIYLYRYFTLNILDRKIFLLKLI